MSLNGLATRDIGRFLSISKDTVMNILKKRIHQSGINYIIIVRLMGRKIQLLIVKEDIATLTRYLTKCTSLRQEKRVRALLYFKNTTVPNQNILCKELNIGPRTLQKWKKMYKEKGINDFLKEHTRERPSKLISAELHYALEKRLNYNKDPLLGYLHAQEWIMTEFGIELKYSHLRQYLIKHFGSKIKRDRKSYVQKDEGVRKVFLKTSLSKV